jgi:hypothetical protein
MATPRKQVQGVGEAPVVAPVALPGFNYGISQPKAGTNNLLQLAGNLEQVGLLTKGYAGIVQQQQQRTQALERGKAAQFKEQQLEEQRRQAEAERQLAKQQRIHEANLKKELNNKWIPFLSDVEREILDVEKYTSKAEASQQLDTRIEEVLQGITDSLGEDVVNSLPSQLLISSIIPKWKTTALEKHEEAQDKYVIDQQNVQLMETLRAATAGPIDVVNIQSIAEGREVLLKENGIDDAMDRQRILENGFFATLDTLKAKGRYKDARSLMNVMSLTKVDGRRAFGSAVNQEKLNDYSVSLSEEEDKQRTVSKTTQQANYAGYYESALIGLYGMEKFGGAIEPNQMSALKSSLKLLSSDLADDPNLLEGTANEIISSSNPLAAYENKLSELSQSPDAPDLAVELYIGNRSRLNKVRQDVVERPRMPENLSDDYKKEQEEEFLAWSESQTDKPPTVKEFILSQKKNYESWDKLNQLGIEAEGRGAVLNSNYYKGVSSSIGKMMKYETEAAYPVDPISPEIQERLIDETYLGTSGREFQRSATERIQEGLRNAAPKDDKETISILRELEQQEKDRWLRLVNAKRDALKMKPETKIADGKVEAIKGERVIAKPEKEIKEVRTKTPGVAYPSLMRIKRGSPISSISRRMVEEDRRDMESRNYVEQRKLSYYNFGLSRYNRNDIKKIAELGLDTDDVVLFGSKLEAEMKLDEWAAILVKDFEGESLSPEEEKTAEEYVELGIATTDDLIDFGIIQYDLIDRPRDPL